MSLLDMLGRSLKDLHQVSHGMVTWEPFGETSLTWVVGVRFVMVDGVDILIFV